MPAKKTEATATATVSLREVNADTIGAVCGLSNTLTEPKKNFVANNAFSIAQAYFEPKAWFRAIYADEEPVGFVMLHNDAEKSEYFLWPGAQTLYPIVEDEFGVDDFPERRVWFNRDSTNTVVSFELKGIGGLDGMYQRLKDDETHPLEPSRRRKSSRSRCIP